MTIDILIDNPKKALFIIHLKMERCMVAEIVEVQEV
jgi:hypothetical protein